jgi:hypothetical protein
MSVAGGRKPGNGLAITALVLASVFFLPVIPFVGLVLGIIAIATGRSKTLSIIAICIGAFFTLFTTVWYAFAVKGFTSYLRRAKAIEAKTNIRNIGTTLSGMSAIEWAKLSESDWTPPGTACGQPHDKFAADPAAFAGEPWATLGFQIARPHYYQYRIHRDPHGFVVEARGDVDCNGKLSHFAVTVAADGVSPVTSDDELE